MNSRSSDVLVQSFTTLYPHITEGTIVTQQYIYALLQILEYAPQLRKDILSLIIYKYVINYQY
jgi:RNA polymerase I-specific transcription initiation factor RRN3